MHENDFGAMLRNGADAYGHEVAPRPAHLVRTRGDQRRRRKFAGLVVLALAVIAGGGAAYAAIGQPGQPTQPVSPGHGYAPVTPAPVPSPSPSAIPSAVATPPAGAAAVTLRLGHIVFRAPATWRVTYRDAQGDYTVSTGPCAGDQLIGAEGGSACPSFSLITGAGVTHFPVPTIRTYLPADPYNTSTGVTGCPGKPYTSSDLWVRYPPTAPYISGSAYVTTGKTADYVVWRMGCGKHAAATPSFYFEQRDWYLPVSKILVVDEYSIPELPQVLASATWQ
jgi:hypothetical protein